VRQRVREQKFKANPGKKVSKTPCQQISWVWWPMPVSQVGKGL
jgi:hypothetical protein